MANEEALVLDSLALNDEVTLGMVSFSAPVPRQRQDWIGAADSEAQLLVRNPLHENRKITVRLAVVPQASMNVAHDKLLLVLDKLQKASKYQDGIAMTWTPATGTRTVTFDVLSAEIVDLPIDWENGWLAFSPQFTVEMTAKPYWRGTRVLVTSASSSVPLVTQEITSVTGDVPALGELFVTDNATQSRRHVEWGVEGLYYNAATVLILESDSLVVSGFAGAQTTRTGAYDPGAAGNNAIIATGWNTPVAMCGTGNQSHVGTFKVKARVQMPAVIQMRLAWRAGDGPWTANAWAESPAPATFSAIWSEVDLGSVTVPPTVVGTQRWEGRVEIIATGGAVGVDQAVVDYLELIPQLEGYGLARATYSYSPGVIVGTDSFIATTAAAALNARVAPSGGTWATSGDATDLAFSDSFIATGDTLEAVQRITNVAETTGRTAILGSTNYTDTQVDIRSWAIGDDYEQILIARWTDASNYVRLRVSSLTGVETVYLETVVAGTVAVLATTTWARVYNSDYRFRLLAYPSGRAIGQIATRAGATVVEIQGSSTAIATAGTLATGKPGFRDRSVTTVGSSSRRYTEFAASTPAAEPIAVYSGRNMQIRYDDVLRQDSTGTYTGQPPSYRGGRFLVPVGTSRVAVKARRNDVDTAADDNIADSITVQIAWTPRGLAVPR